MKGYPDPRVVLDETDVVDDVFCSVTEPSINVLMVEGVVGLDTKSSTLSVWAGTESFTDNSHQS